MPGLSAAHTHSPKAGQGMNVSLMDSYNLAWKLAYHLLSLTPSSTPSSQASTSQTILQTYATERRAVAHALIDFDQRFSSMFSGKVGSTEHDASGEPLTHEKFLEVFSSGSGFSSGCGIEYAESLIVFKQADSDAVDSANAHGASSNNSPWIRDNWPNAQAQDLLHGALYPGRRLPSLRVVRHVDSIPHELHEAFPSTGRFRVLVLCALDLLTRDSLSFKAVEHVGQLIDHAKHPHLVEMIVLHPLTNIRGIGWPKLPPALKKHAEMKFFCAAQGEAPEGKVDGKVGVRGVQAEDGYSVLCVRQEEGAWAVTRPDGVVGAMGSLEEITMAGSYLGGIIAI
jgi:phenol 2-monooxygenase (NADPH)